MRHLLSILPRPSRYLGIEEGSVHKNPANVSVHIALAFPDLYEVGMSYLGQKILYGIVNQHAKWYAERVFTPCREAIDILKSKNAPLCTMESDTELAKLDAIGFSVTHELCFTNVLLMLDLAGIPLRAKNRTDEHPLVLAGGGCTLAAEPLAPFMDLMLLGEAEENIIELLALLEKSKKEKWPRSRFLSEATQIAGVYVPELVLPISGPISKPTLPTLEREAAPLPSACAGPACPPRPSYPKPQRKIIPNFSLAPYPQKQVIPFGAVHNRLALEIARGCTRGCRFCQAGIIYRPVRERSLENLTELTDKCLSSTGFEDISFLSLSTGDFSAFKTLFNETITRCSREQISVSLPSLRVGSIDDHIMKSMASLRRTGATLAPEAGSERLRRVINKGITEEELLTHVQKLFAHGWQQVKLYFMIGLPTETDEDLDAIIDLCCKVRDVARLDSNGARTSMGRLQVTASFSTFVPKAYTPFQWEAQISHPEIKRRIDYLFTRFKVQKNLKMRWHESDMSFLEGIFSRGDRALADVVETAYKKGDIFTAWLDNFSLSPWLEAMQEHGVTPEDYTGPRNPLSPLPWDHLESGISRDFLLKQRELAFAATTSSDCRYSVCHNCGVCDWPNSPSLLKHSASGAVYKNDLNFERRDQESFFAAPETDINPEIKTEAKAEPEAKAREKISPQSIAPVPHAPPIAPVPPITEAGQTQAAHLPKPKAKKNMPPQIDPELAVKAAIYRLWYSKEERAIFLSQLDLQSIFERAFRRAGLPLSFSCGFHPMPLLTFARALPVGVSSKAEWCAITLREKRNTLDMLTQLNSSLPLGLKFTFIEELPVQKHLPQAIYETFTLALSPKSALQPGLFAAKWLSFTKESSREFTRETKNGPRTIDLRKFFKKIEFDEATGELALEFDWTEKYVSPLTLCLAVTPEATTLDLNIAKTGQILEA